jgi:hypothetical protein
MVIVDRHGKPVAALVSTDDLRRLAAAEDAADLRDVQQRTDRGDTRRNRSSRDGSAEVRIGLPAPRVAGADCSSSPGCTKPRLCQAFSKDIRQSTSAIGV